MTVVKRIKKSSQRRDKEGMVMVIYFKGYQIRQADHNGGIMEDQKTHDMNQDEGSNSIESCMGQAITY